MKLGIVAAEDHSLASRETALLWAKDDSESAFFAFDAMVRVLVWWGHALEMLLMNERMEEWGGWRSKAGDGVVWMKEKVEGVGDAFSYTPAVSLQALLPSFLPSLPLSPCFQDSCPGR